MAKIISASELEIAADALARGNLVAFPTETVYGLGGNALNEEAVNKIFAAKGRPLTDPLICHVLDVDKAVAMWDVHADPEAVELARVLGTAIWPGPLTIVLKAKPSLPHSVTGGSGFVGARIPRHPVALKLLQLVDFPLAGPSANTFGHVSPTTAAHVLQDLGPKDPSLLIIDGGQCDIGIESTVVKVNSVESVEILRRGGVSLTDVQRVLGDKFHPFITIRDTRARHGNPETAMDGPGQLLTHYSPNVQSRLLTPSSFTTNAPAPSERLIVEFSSNAPGTALTEVSLRDAVIIDFGAHLQSLQAGCLAYRDLSATAQVREACFAVFDALRWTETIPGARVVLFPLVSEWPHPSVDAELLDAVEDRLFRAASGQVARICVQ
ncbi:putative translation factor (SUA5) [Trypanosoma rangeli]|uniref:Threonylcarbamoyl-AMP synthase n=1 Tax=Trypanosoma rangeli TaxID=5698 RepID=A0A3R7RHL4_TRYRA|nr:putative translation factor (SUA5) [Trypanosoma rangeli]RNF02807.1 putative translation factor (SUA5) [Trypanosoma rangeli]|eukprot:RNF02807.1 putative translation factor (SUA5) [Trypanosoma rangeli]